MSDLGYIPNLTARSLITKRQNNWYYFKSASKDVRQNPFIVMYCMELHNDVTKKDMLSKYDIDFRRKSFQEVQGMIHTHAVDGFILLFLK